MPSQPNPLVGWGYDEASEVVEIGGALGVIYASNGAIPGQWTSDFRLVTQAVTADFVDVNHATVRFTEEAVRAPQVVDDARDIYDAQLMDLVRAIRMGGATRTPMREGAHSLDLALAATRSAQERREVALR